MRTLRDEADAGALEELARLCRIAAERIESQVDGGTGQDAAVLGHLTSLIEYASACAAAVDAGQDCAQLDVPAVFSLADADDEKHFLETLGMFVSHAIGSVAELEEDILSVESTEEEHHAEVIGGIRRIIHTLKAEFGVLNLLPAQKLCHETETAIDAIADSGNEFPADQMLECADVLKSYLERLIRDASAPLADVTELLGKLRGASRVVGGGAEASAPIALVVEGEFADSLGEFITESRSHLSDAEAAMLAFATDPDNEHINVTFRAFHTIKGVAGFLNLNPLVELAHIAETLLDDARTHRVELNHEDVDLLLAAGDLINQMINGLEGQPMPAQAELSRLVTSLEQASSHSRQEVVTADAGAVSEAGEVTPAADPVEPPAAATKEPISAAPTPAVPSPAEPAAAESPPAAAAPQEDRETPPSVEDRAVLAPQPTSRPVPSTKPESKVAKVERTVKVSTLRLDMLVDMVGELVIAQSMVLQDPTIQQLDSQALSRNIGQVSKITRDLQEAAMSLRMVTVKATFQKMARLVRDVAQKSHKKVALTIQGEDTELDRNVVEQISDPLVHMIRNAIDHGIEMPEDRRRHGKETEGNLLLRAYHQGGSIVIEIKDDGRGIDRDRIIKKAIEKQLLPAETKPSDLSDAEAFGLVFMPGFSTADKVTDLSGRGVGMDVVRRNIEALRGKIEIESRLGAGTTFRMRLPLTLAIIDGMVVRVGSERYIVPTLSIEQSFRPAAEDVHYLADRGECVRVRGTVLPIYRLKRIFCQDSGMDDLSEGILVVVEIDGDNSCLFVDEILGQQQVVIKGLGVQGDRVSGVSGGAIMSDGRIALILDVASLVNSAVSV
ncbi:MAG: chemotaxis protein CheA [Planctomycetes bacterium]|nr:chemotaxis protein CheA [Planctomycetota bacterium]